MKLKSNKLKIDGWLCNSCNFVTHVKLQPLECYQCQTGGPELFSPISVIIEIDRIKIELRDKGNK